MLFSLSVRIAEAHDRKDVAAVPLEELAPLARQAGFTGLSMRASVVSVDSPSRRVAEVRELLDRLGLRVSMVTGDLALAANTGDVGRVLRDPEPYFDLAERLGARLIRVMLHNGHEIRQVRRVCHQAAERGLTIAHQTHWNTLCETVEGALDVVRRVDSPNFGITFEPANLLVCGSEHGRRAVEQLGPHLVNVYFQNMRLKPDGAIVWNTLSRGPVACEYVPLADRSGLDVLELLAALRDIGYAGWFTVHQPLLPGQTVDEAIAEAREAVLAQA